MRLRAVTVGLPKLNISIVVQPDHTIGRTLDRIAEHLFLGGKPLDFIAYSAQQNGEWTLGPDAPDLDALRNGEPSVVTRYCTPTACLDRTKTVADYVGDCDMPGIVTVVLRLTPEEWQRQLSSRELSKLDKLKVENRSSRAIKLDVLVAGVKDLVVSVWGEPDDTIEIVRRRAIKQAFTQLCLRIRNFGGSFNFILYSAKFGDDWPLRPGSSSRLAIENGDLDATLRHLSSFTEMDRDKVVAAYFEGGVPQDAAAMVLSWEPVSAGYYRAIRRQLMQAQGMIPHNNSPQSNAGPAPKVVPTRKADVSSERLCTGIETAVSVWLSSFLSWMGPRTDIDAAKKLN